MATRDRYGLTFEDDGASFRVRRARQVRPNYFAPEIDSDPYDRIFGKSTRRLIRWAILGTPILATILTAILLLTSPPIQP